jgi:rhodanese-related sulfurtransferase
VREDALAVDIRPDEEYRTGHIINAVHVPGATLAEEGGPLQKYKDRPLVVYCNVGSASQQARQRLLKAGFSRVYSLQGGLTAWRSENLPLQ